MFSFFSKSPLTSVTVTEVPQLLKEKGVILIDVREQGEYKGGHARGAQSVPLSTLNAEVATSLKSNTTVYVICQSGGRSSRATGMLTEYGVHAVNVLGGTSAWIAEKLPLE
jgi:rhodanese-related sulfurtransferase